MKRSSLLFFLSFIALGASVDARATVSLEDAIQPRTSEGQWDYSSYYFQGDEMTSGGTAEESIVEVREIEGVTVYRIRLLTDWRTFGERLSGVPIDPDSISYFWEYFDENGSFNFTEDFEDPAPPTSLADFSLTMPYPVEEGYRFKADGSDYEVIAVDFELTVPAGTFETVVYETMMESVDGSPAEDRERYYMAPGVGLVRWEMDLLTEDGSWALDMRDDLFSYSLGE